MHPRGHADALLRPPGPGMLCLSTWWPHLIDVGSIAASRCRRGPPPRPRTRVTTHNDDHRNADLPADVRAELLSRSGAERPIVPGFYPDPTICRVGPDYFLAHSSFEYFPGAPIFHSRDLVSWTQTGNILTRRTQFRRGDPKPSTGIYGSTLRHHDGRFWFVTTNVSDFDAGQVIVHALDAAGPWSEPVFVPQA